MKALSMPTPKNFSMPSSQFSILILGSALHLNCREEAMFMADGLDVSFKDAVNEEGERSRVETLTLHMANPDSIPCIA